MNPSTPDKVIKAPAWALALFSPLFARTIASHLSREHPEWGREQVEAELRAKMGREPKAGEQRLIDQVLERWPSAQIRESAAGLNEAKDSGRLSPSAWVLVLANLLPLYGVFVLGWQVLPLLLLFWIENVIIGLLNAARILCVDPRDGASWIGKLFMVPFFVFHYGTFTAVHGVLIVAFFGGDSLASSQGAALGSLFEAAMRKTAEFQLGWQVLAIGLSHAFSFLWNYIGRGEFRRASMGQLMHAPYGRVMVLHVVILLGGLAVQALNSPMWALLLLVVLKIALDLNAHLKERRRLEMLTL